MVRESIEEYCKLPTPTSSHVMSKTSRDLEAPFESIGPGPDYFEFYVHEIAKVISQDEDFVPFSLQTSDLAENTHSTVLGRRLTVHDYNDQRSSLFLDVIGAGFSDFKRERLKAVLRQGVITLSQEVEEMVDPVLNIPHLKSCLRCKKSTPSYLGPSCEDYDGEHPCKKPKLSASSSSISVPLHASPLNDKVSREVNNDMQILLENDESTVERTMKKYSDELSATLWKMEQKLDKLLDIVMFSCRSMRRPEMQQLTKIIQGLPAQNLDRIAEIIDRRKPSENKSCNEIDIDLEKEDNVTLWRLYYYVLAVENASKLAAVV